MRYIETYIKNDLKKKMVFIGGPRQCGKTTLAQSVLKDYGSGRYFNWDSDADRKAILKQQWGHDDRLLVFDELHKFARWKNWIKGLYDTQKTIHQFLVTGSARLDAYRRGGDSLLGRYHYWRLHPFTLSELPKGITAAEAFKRLMVLGGFPEPFLDGSETQARRWRQERFDRVIRDDIRDLENVKDIQTIALLVDLLRTRVGGIIAVSSLAQDLQVAPATITHWLEILERMYIIFIVKAHAGNLARTIQKPIKVYFYDNADVEGDEGARFENLVATHLLKQLQFFQDRDGYRYELRYIRDREKREVDFVILKDRHVDEIIEAKWADQTFSSSLYYFAEKLKPKRATQIVGKLKNSQSHGAVKMISALEAFAGQLR